MNTIKRLSLVSPLAALALTVGCDASHNSLGHDNSDVLNAGGATGSTRATGGSATQTQPTGGTAPSTSATGGSATQTQATGGTTPSTSAIGGSAGLSQPTGGTTSATTTAIVGEFGAVGADPTNSGYTRASGASPTDTTGTCSTTSVVGTLDGKAVDLLYKSSGGGGGGGGPEGWTFLFWFGEAGIAVLSSTTALANYPENLKSGEVRMALDGKLSLPSLVARTSTVVCVTGPSSVERAPNHYAVTYTGVVSLPDCESGTPVEGALDLCLGSTCVDENLSGNIGDTIYASALGVYGNSTRHFELNSKALEVTGNYVATSATTATLKNTWLTDTANGNVYCASTESSAGANLVKDALGNTYNQYQYHFRGLRFIGNCREVSGTDTLVIRNCLTM